MADDSSGLECNAEWWITLLLPSSIMDEGTQIGTKTLLDELKETGAALMFIILEWDEETIAATLDIWDDSFT